MHEGSMIVTSTLEKPSTGEKKLADIILRVGLQTVCHVNLALQHKIWQMYPVVKPNLYMLFV